MTWMFKYEVYGPPYPHRGQIWAVQTTIEQFYGNLRVLSQEA